MLKKSVAIYVPGTKNVDVPLRRSEQRPYELDVIGKLSRLFGGATSFPALGGYVAQAGNLVVENIRVVRASAETLQPADLAAVREIANDLRLALGQESVSIEVNGALDFVSG